MHSRTVGSVSLRQWTSAFLKMFQFRTIRSIFVNSILFLLGIATTLVVISHREESPVIVCEPTKVVIASADSAIIDVNSNKKELQHVKADQDMPIDSSNYAINGKLGLVVKNNSSRHKAAADNVNNDEEEEWLPAVVPTRGSNNNKNIYDGQEGTGPPLLDEGTLQFDTSVSVTKLRLPFSSQLRRNLVYVVTPTYNRPEQIPELTRVAQALLPVNHLIHWVVVQDVDNQTPGLASFLNKFNLNYSLLKSVKPTVFNKVVGKPRGVGARRAALEWLRLQQFTGVLYFADDDNTYDSDIFRQMQRTKRVSMWPVGLVTELGVSSPIVRQGKVIGFYDGWKAYRKFPVDMAGFAVNLKLIHTKKDANMPWVAGYEEDELLKTLGVKLSDIQPLAKNCTEILVWHTKSIKNTWAKKAKSLEQGLEYTTNLDVLLKRLPRPNPGHGSHGANGVVKNTEAENGFSLMNFLFGGA